MYPTIVFQDVANGEGTVDASKDVGQVGGVQVLLRPFTRRGNIGLWFSLYSAWLSVFTGGLTMLYQLQHINIRKIKNIL